jgi:hypothetical protein
VFVKALQAFKHCETCQPKDKVGLVCEFSLS